MRETNLDIAELKRTIALFNSAASIAMGLNDLATGLASASGAGGVALAAINAAAAGFMIVDELESTAEDVDEKKEELALAEEQLEAAKVANADAAAYLTRAVNAVLERDKKGWFQ